MTLQEAIKTNLPMRRPDYNKNSWIVLDKTKDQSDYDIYVWEKDRLIKAFGADDILAIDWEVKEEKFSLSESQIRNWLEGSMCGRRYTVVNYMGGELHQDEFINDLIKDLKSQ